MRRVASGSVTQPGPRPNSSTSASAFSTSGASSPNCLYAPRRQALAAALAAAGAWTWLYRAAAECTPLRLRAPLGSLIGRPLSDLARLEPFLCRQQAEYHWSSE